jgi:site-specific recombinase XerD
MPKSKNSIRTVYFSDEYAYIINLWREEQGNQKREAGSSWIEQDFVFTNENGSMINLYALTELCSKFEDKCGLRHLKLHGLRHTCASLMIKNGVDIETVKSMFGHESIRTTQQYLSAYDSAKKSAAQTLTDIIIKQKGGDE